MTKHLLFSKLKSINIFEVNGRGLPYPISNFSIGRGFKYISDGLGCGDPYSYSFEAGNGYGQGFSIMDSFFNTMVFEDAKN